MGTSGYEWSRVVASGYEWLRVVTNGYEWLQVVTSGYECRNPASFSLTGVVAFRIVSSRFVSFENSIRDLLSSSQLADDSCYAP